MAALPQDEAVAVRFLLKPLLALVLVAACSDPCDATEVDLRIEAPPSVYAELSRWEVDVFDAEGARVETLRYQTPQQVGSAFIVRLRPQSGDATRTWQVEARGISAEGAVVAHASKEGGYDAGRCLERTLTLRIDCNDAGACNDGGLPEGGPPDAGAQDGGPPLDGAPDSALPMGPFSTPELITSLPEGDDPTLTGDMLEIYFEPFPPNDEGIGFEIWRATRESVDADWGEAQSVPELNLGRLSTLPEISEDGLTIFVSYGDTNPELDVYVATRTSRDEPFSTPVRLAELASDRIEGGVALDATSNTLVLHRDVEGTGMDLIQFVRSTSTAAWTQDRFLSELNTTSNDLGGFFWRNSKTLFFESNRSGGPGGYDIFVATRPTSRGDFSLPERVEGLNTASDESDIWISPDGQTAYFVSDESGASRFYRATR